MRFTLHRIAALCFPFVAVACGDQQTPIPAPAAPTPSTITAGPQLPGPTSGPYTVSGAVLERTPQGARVLAGAAVNLWVQAGRYGYSYWWANGPIYSDATGNFQLRNLIDATGWLQASKQGYVQQCALPSIGLSANASNVDVTLTVREQAWIDASSVPASIPGRIVAGSILEKTPTGEQPVAGAFIDFEPMMDFPAATTYSDANGRYLLCGVSDGDIGVGLGRRVTYAPVPRDLVANLDITLP